jgi:hypothetical protein
MLVVQLCIDIALFALTGNDCAMKGLSIIATYVIFYFSSFQNFRLYSFCKNDTLVALLPH